METSENSSSALLNDYERMLSLPVEALPVIKDLPRLSPRVRVINSDGVCVYPVPGPRDDGTPLMVLVAQALALVLEQDPNENSSIGRSDNNNNNNNSSSNGSAHGSNIPDLLHATGETGTAERVVAMCGPRVTRVLKCLTQDFLFRGIVHMRERMPRLEQLRDMRQDPEGWTITVSRERGDCVRVVHARKELALDGAFSLRYQVSVSMDIEAQGEVHSADVRLGGVEFESAPAARREEVLQVTGGGWCIV